MTGKRFGIFVIFAMLLLVLPIISGGVNVLAAETGQGSQTVEKSDIEYDEETGYYVQKETTTYTYYDEQAGCMVTRIQIVKDYYIYDGVTYVYVDTVKTEQYIYVTPAPAPTLQPSPRPTRTPKPTPTPGWEPGETAKPKPTPTQKPGPVVTPKPTPTVKPFPTKSPITPAPFDPGKTPEPTPYVITPNVEFDTEPIDFSAKRKSANSTQITWKTNKKADGYYIYRAKKENGNYKKIKTIKDSSIKKYIDKDVKSGSVYYYKVQAYVYTIYGVLTTEMSEPKQVSVYKMQQIKNKLKKLKKEFPDGKYWNHVGYKVSAGQATYKYVTDKPCKSHDSGSKGVSTTCNSFTVRMKDSKTGKNKTIKGYQCYGFANYIGYRLFGSAKITSHNSYKKAKVGDHVRINNHSVVIIEKHEKYIVVAECNIGGNCRIRWGRKISKSALKNPTYFTKQ